jgi:hypothetical protein
MAIDWGEVGSGVLDFITSDTGGALIGGALGGIVANQGDKGQPTKVLTGTSSGGSSSTSTSRSGLPEYLRKYLDQEGGIYPEAQRIYQQNMGQGYIGETSGMKGINQGIASTMQNQYGAGNLNQNLGAIGDLTQGNRLSLEGVDPTQARQSMGQLDPTQALSNILGGQIDTRGLDQLQQAAGNRAMVGYNDMVDDAAQNFTQKIAPQLRSNALLTGQYGGSRQDVAEGVAAGQLEQQLSRNARDLTQANMDIGTQLYGDAYNLANRQKFDAAQGLGTQAMQNAQFGKNYGIGASAQNANLAQTGLNMQGQAQGQYLQGQDAAYGALNRGVQDQQMQQAFPWQQLQQYAGIIQRAPVESTNTSTSGSSHSSESYTMVPGTGTSVLGGIEAGANLGQGVAGMIDSYRQTAV